MKVQQEDADRKFGESEQQHKEELRQRQAEAEKALKDKEKHHQQEMEAKRLRQEKNWKKEISDTLKCLKPSDKPIAWSKLPYLAD